MAWGIFSGSPATLRCSQAPCSSRLLSSAGDGSGLTPFYKRPRTVEMQPSVIREGSAWDVWLVGTRGQETSVRARPGLVHKGPGRHFLSGWSAPLKIVPEGVRGAQKGAPFFAMLREEHRERSRDS